MIHGDGRHQVGTFSVSRYHLDPPRIALSGDRLAAVSLTHARAYQRASVLSVPGALRPPVPIRHYRHRSHRAHRRRRPHDANAFRRLLFDQVTTQENVPFRTARNERGEAEVLHLDVYLPAGDDLTGARHPLDPRRRLSARKRQAAGLHRPHGDCVRPARLRLLRLRLSRAGATPERHRATVSEAVDDCRAALCWIRERAATYGVDPRRVAVAGGSAGA
jgi:hypothetical protein